MRRAVLPFITVLFSLSTMNDLSAQTDPFTGRVIRNRVRLRAGADVTSPILRELDHGTLISVVGEQDVFYAVKPSQEVRGYIYRTYVLDNVVDAAKVNVRLEPNLDAPIIAQLNKGDRVEGQVSALNSRWMEIQLPASVNFYIAKDFVEHAGDADLPQRLQSRREEAAKRINAAYLAGQIELQKPMNEMKLDEPISELHKVVVDYSDLADEVARAKNILAILQNANKQKKRESWPSPSSQPPAEEETPQTHQTGPANAPSISESMSSWYPKEVQLYEQWHASHPDQSMDQFYAEQRAEAVQLRGIVQPYMRQVKNRPGNFLLINHLDQQPIAFLYSTQVDLQKKVGRLVSIVAISRPNNQFAFPSFFVVSAEE